ncbi:MAG TPA: type II secretion system major pseudopilin GspG [Phycisphaerales bacterium]|nr:type II secretion system major pseudopilin GspG [Phycisphaerales bacterium]HMP37987.1 type II secretion system major pseudopilin GspG [Phycisphaerales bacterium]
MKSLKAPSRPRSPLARRRGFTLLELLIVIGILLAIGGIVLVNVLGASDKADRDLVQVEIRGFEQALERFKLDLKRWPTEEEGIVVLWSRDRLDDDEDRRRWAGPYLKEPKAKDTWGNEWIYRAPSTLREGAAYDIISPGPDRQEGTEDDITNHAGKTGEAGDEFGDFTR